MRQFYFSLFLVIMSIVLCSCQENGKKLIVESQKTEEDLTPILLSSFDKDTISLNQIADTVFYVALDYNKLNNVLQIEYNDSLLFVNDCHSILIFNSKGEYIRSISLEKGSMDVDFHSSHIYTYCFLTKELCSYDFSGNKLWSSRVKGGDFGYMGYNFASVSDTLFVIANMNKGYNSDRLVFVNDKGRIIHRIANSETFEAPARTQTYNSAWKRTVFKNKEGILYHPFYNDTVYSIQGKELIPVIIEQSIEKVPLEERLEYTGKSVSDFTKYCVAENKYATRFYDTPRFTIVEYQLGSLENSLSNYLVYDKKKQEVKRSYNDLIESLEKSELLHLGIKNDYDGGLAFQPMFQSQEYLIMVGAGSGHGGKSAAPSELYRLGRNVLEKHYACVSQEYKSLEHKERVKNFFDKNRDDKTILTVVRVRK